MDLRRALVPYHFHLKWDIIPNRAGPWEIIDIPGPLVDRLRAIKRLDPDVVVAGDCMAAIAAQRNGLPLVWLDAHGDFHTVGTSWTGSLGGMPLAMLCGLGEQTLLKSCWTATTPYVFHVGGSVFDSGERERMAEAEVTVVEALDEWPGEPIHLHVDTDVIRTADLPSSIHPAPNGMPLSIFWRQMEILLPHASVLSIKTYDPRLDVSGIGEKIVLEILERYHELRRTDCIDLRPGKAQPLPVNSRQSAGFSSAGDNLC